MADDDDDATRAPQQFSLPVETNVDSEDPSQSRPRKRKRPSTRRKTVRWSRHEVDALIDGVRVHGVGKWVAILRHSHHVFNGVRTSVDLKDKWRNLTSPTRAAILASSAPSSPIHQPLATCSNLSSSASAPLPSVAEPSIGQSSFSFSTLDESNPVRPVDAIISFTNNPLYPHRTSNFNDPLNLSSPNSSCPELCLPPQSHGKPEARTPQLNAPSESSVSPELLTDAPTNRGYVPVSTASCMSQSWPSYSNAYPGHAARVKSSAMSPPSIPHPLQRHPVMPQHHASVQSALHRTLTQSIPLAEYWRTLSVHPTSLQRIPFPSNPSMISHLFSNDDDDDDDDDDANGGNSTMNPIVSISCPTNSYSTHLDSSVLGIPSPQSEAMCIANAPALQAYVMGQQQLGPNAHNIYSYPAAYGSSRLPEQGGSSMQNPFSSVALTNVDPDSHTMRSPDVIKEKPEEQVIENEQEIEEIEDLQPCPEPNMLMQVLREFSPQNFES